MALHILSRFKPCFVFLLFDLLDFDFQTFQEPPFIKISRRWEKVDKNHIIILKSFHILEGQNHTLLQSERKKIFLFFISDQNDLLRTQLEYFTIGYVSFVLIKIITVDVGYIFYFGGQNTQELNLIHFGKKHRHRSSETWRLAFQFVNRTGEKFFDDCYDWMAQLKDLIVGSEIDNELLVFGRW